MFQGQTKGFVWLQKHFEELEVSFFQKHLILALSGLLIWSKPAVVEPEKIIDICM